MFFRELAGVSILVVLDVVLEDTLAICCVGIFLVSILVVLDVVLEVCPAGYGALCQNVFQSLLCWM